MSICLSWSSGKDSALALHHLRQAPDLSVRNLLTTVHGPQQRIAMHGIGVDLIRKQVRSLGLPLQLVSLPDAPSNEEYAEAIELALKKLKNEGISTIAFGDILLEDVRRYREEKMKSIGMNSAFPLWGRSTERIAEEFIESGFRAVVVCVDGTVLDRSFLGREYNADFLRDLPKNVDPAGENGEFHTFCYDGPVFQFPVEWERGTISHRDFPAPQSNKSDNANRRSRADTMRFWCLDIFRDETIAENG